MPAMVSPRNASMERRRWFVGIELNLTLIVASGEAAS
jgi:hypothetical protein